MAAAAGQEQRVPASSLCEATAGGFNAWLRFSWFD
jgi:hypothetical protein